VVLHWWDRTRHHRANEQVLLFNLLCPANGRAWDKTLAPLAEATCIHRHASPASRSPSFGAHTQSELLRRAWLPVRLTQRYLALRIWKLVSKRLQMELLNDPRHTTPPGSKSVYCIRALLPPNTRPRVCPHPCKDPPVLPTTNRAPTKPLENKPLLAPSFSLYRRRGRSLTHRRTVVNCMLHPAMHRLGTSL